MASAQGPRPLMYGQISSDGQWTRMPSRFRNFIPSEQFPAEKGRYVLYANYCCPWAHRTLITRALKGLEDIVQVIEVDSTDPIHGWHFGGWRGPSRDPIYGVKYIKELFLKVDPHYNGRVTVPMLWDKKNETIVSNESSDIMQMFFSSFDEFLPPEQREENKGDAAFVPQHLRHEIETLNAFVFDNINNGVYKTGFASSQTSYEQHVVRLFQALDRVEQHLTLPGHQPYLFGPTITDADIRLYTTLIRLDIAYGPSFKCNLKMIRYDYPKLHTWLRRLYWNEGPETAGGAFKSTTHFHVIKRGYSLVAAGNGIVPMGPLPHILPLES